MRKSNEGMMPPGRVQLIGPAVQGLTVCSWCPSPDGSGDPVAVALVFNIVEIGDIVMRLKSRRAVDDVIDALQKHKTDVFGGGA